MESFHRYLPLSDETRAQDLYVLAGGQTDIPPRTPYPPLGHPADHQFGWREGRTLDEYQLIYIDHGGGTLETRRGGCHKLTAGGLFMLFPGEWHRYSPDAASGWHEFWVAFHGAGVGEIMAGSPLQREEPALDVTRMPSVAEEMALLLRELRQEGAGYETILAARTRTVLALAAACSRRRAFDGTNVAQIVERARCIMSARIDQELSMDDLAQELGVGYSWFRRVFREYTGLPPAQYHLQLRVRHACNLLRTTTLPVGLVGQRTGFASAYYFARIFRQKMGCTPSAYRATSQTVQDVLPDD